MMKSNTGLPVSSWLFRPFSNGFIQIRMTRMSQNVTPVVNLFISIMHSACAKPATFGCVLRIQTGLVLCRHLKELLQYTHCLIY